MNKKVLFNRSVLSKAKGHEIKRKSSKGLVTGIALAGAVVLLGSSPLVSADDLQTWESGTASSAVTNTADADTQASDSPDKSGSQTSETDSASENPAASEPVSEAKGAELGSSEGAAEKSGATAEKQEVSDQAAKSDTQTETPASSEAATADEAEQASDYYRGHDGRSKSRNSAIQFDEAGARTSSAGVSIDGKNVTITSAGTYTLAGSASGYSISVADQVTDPVKLRFDAVHLSESRIYSPKDLEIRILADSSIVSSLNNTIETGGALYISGRKRAGLEIASREGHAIKAASLQANNALLTLSSANKDGINADSSVFIKRSTVTISAGDDGIQAKDKTDVNSGDVEIKDSVVTITSGHKGITASDEITVTGSTSTITITAGFEGIEGRYVHLNKGNIKIKAEDDAINAVEWTGKDDADLSKLTNSPDDIENRVAIVISGAHIDAISTGDGMDSNGDLIITAGSLKTQSITDYNSALDYDGTGFTSGGTTWAIGHMGFAQGLSTGTKQAYVAAIVSGLAGDTITIRDSRGRIVAETGADVDFDHIVFSSRVIREGQTYTVTSSDGHQATVTGTKETTNHPSGRIVDKKTVPLLPNGHHPAFPGNGTPPSNDGN